MRFKISLEYTLLSDTRINFPIPQNFVWIAGGICLRTDVRDWQIAGDTGVGSAVEQLIEFCEREVQAGNMRSDYRLEITK